MLTTRSRPVIVSATLVSLWIGGSQAQAVELSKSRIYIEYNQSANDLGYHVSLDGEDWTRLGIFNPNGKKIFEVQGRGAYKLLGMHAVPNGPGDVSAVLSDDSLVISWDPVTTPPPGFPERPISITGYQLIVGAFQVTVPDTVTSVTVSREFVASLPSGEVLFEVLAIDVSGNQTITESSFVKP